MKIKITAIFICLVMVISFVSCSGKKDNKEEANAATGEVTQASVEDKEKKDIEVKEYGYDIRDGYLFASVIVHNPNENTAIECPTFRMTAIGSDGSVLGTEDQTLSIIYPGHNFVYAGQAFEVKGKVSKFKVEIIPTEDYNFLSVSELDNQTYKMLKVENVKKVDDEFFPKYTGEITNENSYDISSGIITIVFRDSNGKLLGGDSTFVDGIKSGAKTPFELSANDPVQAKKYEVYANNWD